MATTIFDLIDDGDLDGVRALLARDPAVAAVRDEQGLSALMRAAYRGGGEILEAVRAAGPPLDPWDRLVTGEADGLPAPGERSPDGFAPLHIAVFAHNAAAVRTLLAAGADPNELATASFAQVTPLGTAATFGANEIAELLLDRGADTERTSDHGNTPLHSAAATGNRALVELLLARGANAGATLSDGRTPADLAPNDEIRELLT
ncbi:MAG TPA: ankyrin repeat domain-containing protein [Gaiellaceae bacterium]